METVTIFENKLEAAKALAAAQKVLLVEVERFAHPGRKNVTLVQVQLIPDQTGDATQVLAYAELAGLAISLSTEFEWTQQQLENLHYTRCDRCEAAHQRTRVWIVKEVATQKVMQVGGQCAKMMNCETRVKELLKRVGAVLKQFTRNEAQGYCYHADMNPGEVLLTAAILTRVYGFVGRKNETDRNERTSHKVMKVLEYLSTDRDYLEELRAVVKSNRYPEETATQWVEKAEAYLEAQPFSEYVFNCQQALNYANLKLIGYLASLPFVMTRDEEKAKQREAQAVREKTPVVGEVLEVEAPVTKVVDDTDYYGNSCRKVTMYNATYGRLWLKTTADWSRDLNQGDTVKMKVTVTKVLDTICFCKAKTRKVEIVEAAPEVREV